MWPRDLTQKRPQLPSRLLRSRSRRWLWRRSLSRWRLRRSNRLALKSPKGYVVLTIGLPGSGKTTWYKRRGVTPLSSDLLRTLSVR